jgi:predicted extracellular nuclease
MKYFIIFLLIKLLNISDTAICQDYKTTGKSINDKMLIAFYNCENLFDISDDTAKQDDEFLPGSIKRWNKSKFYNKLYKISRIIIALGGWNPPVIIGLCEVENDYVLNKLVYGTPLLKWNYQYIHMESPDIRGIDVALLYRPDYFLVTEQENIRVFFPFDQAIKTRDILYVKGVLLGQDTIHLLVNHWPSRYGNYAATKKRRIHTAKILRHKVDSIINSDHNPYIIIMGDFNDGPLNQSIDIVVNGRNDSTGESIGKLINLFKSKKTVKETGTIKYKGEWDIFDQILVSSNLINKNHSLFIVDEIARIYNPEFLLINDDKYWGKKPFRTWAGPRYIGGYSDHLPVYIVLGKPNE